MADGEALKGACRLAFSSFPLAWLYQALEQRPPSWQATGPENADAVQGTSSTMGDGSGDCQPYDGAIGAISW